MQKLIIYFVRVWQKFPELTMLWLINYAHIITVGNVISDMYMYIYVNVCAVFRPVILKIVFKPHVYSSNKQYHF